MASLATQISESSFLQLPKNRKDLSAPALTAFFRMMQIWGVRDEDARALLGGVTNGPYYSWKKHPERVVVSVDGLTRISLLLGIFDSLNTLFGQELADKWISLPNTNRIFGGNAPLQFMIRGGIPAILTVRRLLEARAFRS